MTVIDPHEGHDVIEGEVVDRPHETAGKAGTTAARWEGDPRAGRPIVPTWIRDRDTAGAAARWAVRYGSHAAAFHTTRAPLYWGRLAARSPHGAARLTGRALRWVTDAESAPMRRALVAATGDHGRADPSQAAAFGRLEAQRRQLIRGRIVTAGVVVLVAVVGVLAILQSVPAPALVALAAAGIAVLGWIGRDAAGAPIMARTTEATGAPRMTSDLVLTALGALGIAELNKGIRAGGDAGGVVFPSPIVRDGAGWRAEVDLPPGVPAGDVAERRDRLAAGLRRPLSCVWPEGDQDSHAGRLVLWVADQPMSKVKPAPWPLAERGTVNVFQPFPVGTDPRGRTVTTEIVFVSGVIGAQPRMGKTFSMRLIFLAAALDPRVELHIFDGKGGADWRPLETVAHAFRLGDSPEDAAYVLADLRALKEDMNRRYRVLQNLDREVCPEGKVTDELASQKSLGLHPVLVGLDECQRYFEHPTHGKELAELTEDVARRGPAAAITVLSATQRIDTGSLPRGISANAALRICLKVAGQIENDMVLGTSSYQAGVRATMFSRSDKGVAYLAGEGDAPIIVRFSYIDAEDADRIAGRARTARVAGGRLTGYAADADQVMPESTASILDHLVAVWPPERDRVWCDELATRLATAYPTAYEGWAAEQVTSAVRPFGLATRQIKRGGVNKRGLVRADFDSALIGAPRGSSTPAEG